jgi:phenylacetate-CoA ligase
MDASASAATIDMTCYVPEEEMLDAADLAALQRRKLAAMLRAILPANAFYGRKLAGMSVDSIVDGFDSLPLTTRDEIQSDQLRQPPYGTNLSFPIGDYVRLHQTSGSTGAPLRCLDRAEDWQWWKRCWAVIYRGAGVQAGDRFIFPFTFGPFIGFWAAFESAVALGNLCLAAGGMTTKARLDFMMRNGATWVCCTPTYALRMAEVAAAEGIDLAAGQVRGLIVAGEPGGNLPVTRQAIADAWGARVFDHAGMTEIGPYGFECVEAPGGFHVMENEFIPEVIDSASGRAVGDGVEGELVLTNLGRWGHPLIRYRTEDRVRLTRGRCACGRSFARIDGGILGRADDMFFIRGNNVYPSAVEDAVRGVAGVAEFRFEVELRGPMTDLRVDVEPGAGADASALAERVSEAIRDRMNFRPTVILVECGALPRYEMKARRWSQRTIHE